MDQKRTCEYDGHEWQQVLGGKRCIHCPEQRPERVEIRTIGGLTIVCNDEKAYMTYDAINFGSGLIDDGEGNIVAFGGGES